MAASFRSGFAISRDRIDFRESGTIDAFDFKASRGEIA
jgi:hypothetical protein